MKVYVVTEVLEDWGANPRVFSTEEKAQAFIRDSIAEEVLCRIEVEDFDKPIGEVFYAVEYNKDNPRIIDYVQYDKEGKNYLSYDEREVE